MLESRMMAAMSHPDDLDEPTRQSDRSPLARSGSRADPDDLTGEVIAGKYHVERLIGRGGMGRIYLATQAPLDRPVALKVLGRDYVDDSTDPLFLKRFFLEASTCAKLIHPNTVKVYDYGEFVADAGGRGTCFIAMEYIEGWTLEQTLRDEGPFTPGRVLRIVREVARSLREAHEKGIIHRDLKPSNIMLSVGDEGESIKVLDFGIAKVRRDDGDTLTGDGRFLGSPRYMSPEAIRARPIDGRADIYALGVVMYELLTGAPPFAGAQSIETILGHINEPVPAMNAVCPTLDMPASVERVVMRCLEKNPDDRYADIEVFIHNVERALEVVEGGFGRSSIDRRPVGIAPPAPPPPNLTPPPYDLASAPGLVATAASPRAARRRWAPVLALLALGAFGVGGYFARGGQTEAAPAGADAEVGTAEAPIDKRVVPAIVAPPPAPEAIAVVPAPPAVEPPRPTEVRTVAIHTSPSGAAVYEGDEPIGITPLEVSVPTGPAFAARHLELRQPGYRPAAVEIGHDIGVAIVERTLKKREPVKRQPAARGPGVAEPGDPGDLDIRISR